MIITLLLARFLTPKDYGLVAMMSVFLAVASSLMDSGFKQALIRARDARQVDLNTAFYANLALGVVAYSLLFVASPYIAVFYEEPRLVAMVRVAAIGILINSFQVVQSAILSRDLNFKLQLQATLPAGLCSGAAAVYMAYSGGGAWALVVQMLLASLVATIVLWLKQGWRPTLGGSSHSLRQLYGFGYKLFLSSVLDKKFANMYVIVIAKLFSVSVAGFYFLADRIKEIILAQLVNSIQTVTYPALASVQHDDLRLKSAYRRVISVSVFLLFPAMIFTAALAAPIFQVLLPSRWGACSRLPAIDVLGGNVLSLTFNQFEYS
jgi:O-antigen/teichoic acid export membrane protein